MLKTYSSYKRWLQKSDVWQLQALRAKALNKSWTQQDKILNCTYTSYEQLAEVIESVKEDFKKKFYSQNQ